jgi:regulator of cell morphogenesis and NO signaling
MSESHTLDVTRIEPRLKHPTIFQHFDALPEGGFFVIHNDHDPKPLYYQLLSERGNIFTWEYLQEGPDWWKIKIYKKKLTVGEETIGSIAAKDLRKAEVFKKYGIDFCCNGKKSLKEACDEAGVAVQEVENDLENLPLQSSGTRLDYDNWSLDFLADYIVNVHHKYVTDAIPLLAELSQKVAQRHGAAHPELDELRLHVRALLTEMQSHQIKEEKILFPFIRQMVRCERENEPFTYPPFGTIESPVQMMVDDHNEAARHVHAIEHLSKDYTVPEDGCESYKLYYHKLHEFNDDLYQHIHLENNILFPKAITLEKELLN